MVEQEYINNVNLFLISRGLKLKIIKTQCNKKGDYMDLNKEIERVKENICYYERMLSMMPDDSILGRICLEAYLIKDRKKLKKLMAKKNNSDAYGDA